MTGKRTVAVELVVELTDLVVTVASLEAVPVVVIVLAVVVFVVKVFADAVVGHSVVNDMVCPFIVIDDAVDITDASQRWVKPLSVRLVVMMPRISDERAWTILTVVS